MRSRCAVCKTTLPLVSIPKQHTDFTVGRNFEHEEYDHAENTLPWKLHYAQLAQNVKQQWQAQSLIATMDGRYDFLNANLNSLVNFQPVRFRDWLQLAWHGRL